MEQQTKARQKKLVSKWEQLISVNVSDEDMARQGRLFNTLMLISIGIVIFLPLFFFITIFLDLMPAGVGLLGAGFPLFFIPFSIFCLFWAKKDHIKQAINLYVWVNFFAISMAAFVFDGVLSPAWILYIWTITIAGSLLSPGYALGMTGVAIAYFFVLLDLSFMGVYSPPMHFPPKAKIFLHMAFLLTMFVSSVGLLTYLNMKSLRQAFARLKNATDELKKHRDSLEQTVEERTKDLKQEIVERKKIEDALMEEKNRYQALFENSADGIYLHDLEGNFIGVNSAAEKIIGYSQEELLSINIRSFLNEEQIEESTRIVRTPFGNNGQDKKLMEFGLKKKDGSSVWVEVMPSMILKDDKPCFVQGIVRDVTGRKEADKKMQQAMEDLRRANAELQQFAYVASHDLQEPLRMVASFSQLLERRYKDKLGKDADDFIGYVVEGANRLQGLIEDLLKYSRVSTRGNPFVLTDFNVVLDRAIAAMSLAIEDCKAIITHDNLPAIMADELQMRDLFQHLIENAIKFGKENVPPKIHVSANQEGGEWIFSVEDNGIGIAPEYFDRIFVIFQRLHGRGGYSGNGIGLAVSKRIINRHDGRIWVDSIPGKGSIFHFSIQVEK
jgi:PAS domain S-box-containing protein